MNTLTIRYNDVNDTFEISFFSREELKVYLSSLPQDKRTWSPTNKCWVILPDTVCQVIVFSKGLFDKIDFSSVPPNYQKTFSEAYKRGVVYAKENIKENSNYRDLFLIESAPDFIIKAAYKALAKAYHPDGETPDEEKFMKIKNSYNSILNRKS